MGKIENPNDIDEIIYTPTLLKSHQDLYEALIEDGNGEIIQSSIESILDELGFVGGAKLIANTAFQATLTKNTSSQ